MIRSALLLVLVSCAVVVAACKTTETPPPAPAKDVKAEPVDAGPAKAEEPPPPPSKAPGGDADGRRVVLPEPPPLPNKPLGLPALPEVADNPTTPEKAELGHRLFFDKRLSKDGSMACNQCHLAARAWTTENALDAKVGGAMNKRNTPGVVNLAFHTSFYWDGRMPTLEAVSNAAWKGQLGADPAVVSAALNDVPMYKAMFQRAFAEDANVNNVPRALAAFLRTLNSGNSAWDKAQAGDKSALTAEQQEGFKVFSSKGCVNCHVPPLFTNFEFENVGIGDDPGRKDFSKADEDFGKFKVPTLRNVALTAPYFHDGSAKTLEEAIAFMAKGGGKPVAPGKISAKLKAQKLSPKEAKALKAFLESLSGDITWAQEPVVP
ncbi:MAG: c-type cytochrome [Archangium sp.]|nr:c-type cytochrome [Archangium sp.]